MIERFPHSPIDGDVQTQLILVLVVKFIQNHPYVLLARHIPEEYQPSVQYVVPGGLFSSNGLLMTAAVDILTKATSLYADEDIFQSAYDGASWFIEGKIKVACYGFFVLYEELLVQIEGALSHRNIRLEWVSQSRLLELLEANQLPQVLAFPIWHEILADVSGMIDSRINDDYDPETW